MELQLSNIPPDPRLPRDHRDLGYDEVTRKLHERGVIVLGGRLDSEAAERTIVQLLALDRDPARVDPGTQLTLQVTGLTGDVGAALAVHDVLTTMTAPVAIVAGGLLDTAGAVVVAGGSKGHRRLLPSARIHLRRPEGPSTEGLSLESAAREVELLRDRAQRVLGVAIHPPRMLDGGEAVALGIADLVE